MAKWVKRECYQQLHDYVYGNIHDRVYILYGLRRTGKIILIRQLISEMDAVQERTSDVIIVNDVEIEYRIIQKRNSERCFLEMSSTERVNKAIGALQVVDDAIFKSSQQKYYHSLSFYPLTAQTFVKGKVGIIHETGK